MRKPSDEALAAIHAWTRPEDARPEFGRAVERRYGVTGARLAVLRLVAEHDPDGTTPRPVPYASARRAWLLTGSSAAFDDALDLFGWREWAAPETPRVLEAEEAEGWTGQVPASPA
ncbi:hypothetical protein [Actinoallomurus acaciae]|uniref:Uncharacterized protein n=1 Tax=Actinoallomurus acaciae TaxID=502577 RepID=A0ABV5YKM3_9ACTN